jgi:hypothetical protein
MQALSATVIATGILFFADQFMNAGRYSDVVVVLLMNVGWLVGIHV